MTHKFYHYTSDTSWDMIQEDKKIIPQRPIIGQRDTTINSIFPEWTHERHIFGMYGEPAPQEWRTSQYGLEAWNYLFKLILHDMDTHLIRLDIVLPKNTTPKILDRLPAFELETKKRSDTIEAFKEYSGSAIFPEQYKRDYQLPEIVVAREISIDNIVNVEILKK